MNFIKLKPTRLALLGLRVAYLESCFYDGQRPHSWVGVASSAVAEPVASLARQLGEAPALTMLLVVFLTPLMALLAASLILA